MEFFFSAVGLPPFLITAAPRHLSWPLENEGFGVLAVSGNEGCAEKGCAVVRRGAEIGARELFCAMGWVGHGGNHTPGWELGAGVAWGAPKGHGASAARRDSLQGFGEPLGPVPHLALGRLGMSGLADGVC